MNVKKQKNENVVATISHTEYKNVLSNQCIGHQWIKLKHRIETYEIKKVSLSCFFVLL